MNRTERAARLREAADYLTSGPPHEIDLAAAAWLRATADRVAPAYGRNHSWSGSREAMRLADAVFARRDR